MTFAPHLCTLDCLARVPIDMSRICLAHVSEKSPSNFSQKMSGNFQTSPLFYKLDILHIIVQPEYEMERLKCESIKKLYFKYSILVKCISKEIHEN